MNETLKSLYDRFYTPLPLVEYEQEVEACHHQLIERLEKEKAALMEIAKARPICATCKHHIGCKAVELADCRRCIRRKDCVCVQCVGWAKWERKGLVENK